MHFFFPSFFFIKKAASLHGETDASQFPPWLLYPQGGMVTHSYQVLTKAC